jgi:TRIAD3 protein (E3 ubiquitin-protein ligase RNF216)
MQKHCFEKAIINGTVGNLEKCPWCDFAMVMDLPPEENKIFVCQSAACGKHSCRLCKQESHIPLRCEEVEKKVQASFRLSVEEAMSEAFIRECPGCKAKGVSSRFFKGGADCNKMTCPKCNGWVCYVCGEQIPKKVGYKHFCDHPFDGKQKSCNKCTRCPLWSGSAQDLAKAEKKRILDAGLKVSQEYRSEHQGKEGFDENDLEVLRELKETSTGASGSRPAKNSRKR